MQRGRCYKLCKAPVEACSYIDATVSIGPSLCSVMECERSWKGMLV